MIEYIEAAQLMEGLGMDSAELLQRAKFRNSVELSIERGDIGFRGGWISTARIDSDLPPQHWAGILEAIGYVLHPTLAKVGRTQLLPGEGRTRLFIERGSAHASVSRLKHALHYYRHAQE